MSAVFVVTFVLFEEIFAVFVPIFVVFEVRVFLSLVENVPSFPLSSFCPFGPHSSCAPVFPLSFLTL